MTKRHPGQRRLPQDHQENEDDIFVAKVLEVGNWAQRNQQLLTVGGIVAVIAVAAFLYYGNYRDALAVQAANELELVHQSVTLGDTEGAKNELVIFLDRFGGTAYSGEARMLLGELYLRTEASPPPTNRRNGGPTPRPRTSPSLIARNSISRSGTLWPLQLASEWTRAIQPERPTCTAGSSRTSTRTIRAAASSRCAWPRCRRTSDPTATGRYSTTKENRPRGSGPVGGFASGGQRGGYGREGPAEALKECPAIKAD
jgi:hypothetical protein